MFKIEHDRKRGGYNILLYPVKNIENAKRIQSGTQSGVWVYVFDLKAHRIKGRTAAAIVIPQLLDAGFHPSEEEVVRFGYRPHWMIYENRETGELSFGNKPSFANSFDEEDVERANSMPVIHDLDRFLETEML